MRTKSGTCVLLGLLAPGCTPDAPPPDERPSILLVTLDTTRADAMGYESDAARTPHLDTLAARGLRFSQAYATAPMTLPSHTSMLTGLYPADHGVRENARYLGGDKELLAERLRGKGYETAAFVSGLPLSRPFGLARGFGHYDDEIATERRAAETTERALAWLRKQAGKRVFLWVHYFDPHEPYEPPEPFRSEIPDPYLAEVAAMDCEVGRLLDELEARTDGADVKILVAGDHGEGRGDHGEALHGNLLYQGVMRVPLLIAGRGIDAGAVSHPVSLRRVFDTVLDWAGEDRPYSLTRDAREIVLGEAMKPFLQYGWQPQVMAVTDEVKVIRSGEVEIYDVREDPREAQDLAGERQLDGDLLRTIDEYLAKLEAGEMPQDGVSQEDRERLASLGYVSWEGGSRLRDDAPSAREMTGLFADLDRGSGLFVQQRYDEAIPVFAEVFEQDPGNLMVALRLAVACSVTGRDRRALEYFERARAIDPESVDVRHYLGMHYFREQRFDDAGALLASVVAETPDRLPALEALARVRQVQGRLAEAAALLERLVAVKSDPVDELLELGDLRMALGETGPAITAFERAREIAGDGFPRSLELGVLYLADRRLEEARDCLDRVPPSHPGYPMALFKRAQVAVLLGEPDREERIRLATRRADDTTRRLIDNEALFR
jgi:arylsulfatase A-like enzyme/Tfp pilus assembly protein PilF